MDYKHEYQDNKFPRDLFATYRYVYYVNDLGYVARTGTQKWRSHKLRTRMGYPAVKELLADLKTNFIHFCNNHRIFELKREMNENNAKLMDSLFAKYLQKLEYEKFLVILDSVVKKLLTKDKELVDSMRKKNYTTDFAEWEELNYKFNGYILGILANGVQMLKNRDIMVLVSLRSKYNRHELFDFVKKNKREIAKWVRQKLTETNHFDNRMIDFSTYIITSMFVTTDHLLEVTMTLKTYREENRNEGIQAG